MKNIFESPFIKEMVKMTTLMFQKGWDERNGGNISYMLDEDMARPYLDTSKPLRSVPMEFDASPLAGKLFLVTGTGKYFMSMADDPEANMGIVKVAEDGHSVDILWGYKGGGAPTSELPAHFMSHIARLRHDPLHRVVMHTHATNVIAMTFLEDPDDRTFTRIFWKMCTECMVVFPDGVGVLPWMLCGGDDIGYATAKKMEEYRLVIWGQHGIFGAGQSMEETFGLIDTVEKAAEIYMKVKPFEIKHSITDDNLSILAKAFGVMPKDGFLDK